MIVRAFPLRSDLVVALLLTLLPLGTPAFAQDTDNSLHSQRERRLQQIKGDEAGQHDRRRGKKPDEAPPALYPNATRQEPDAKPSRDGVKILLSMQEALQANDNTKVLSLAQSLPADANAYERGFAFQLAGSAAAATGDDAGAAGYFAKSLEANGLPNNDYYTVMFNLAATQYGLDKYEEALKTIDRFLAETKSDKPEAEALRAGALMSLERYEDAAAIYVKRLETNPADHVARVNAVAAYQSADKPEKAMALLADAQAKGLLTKPDEYRALYVSYINADHDKDAVKIIEDGVSKGIVVPGQELAKDYQVLAQKAYYADDVKNAIELYRRAASMSTDGEASLNLAKVYANEGRKAEARTAATEALAKGVKDTAAAKRLGKP